MILTAGQQQALACIKDLGERFPDGGGIGVISGYAGTGKTTLLKVLADNDDKLFVLTPTGKAAVRVREVTGAEGMTIHRWLYEPFEDEESGEVTYTARDIGDIRVPGSGTLLVDEASMVGFDVFRDLYEAATRLRLNLVLIGDGFQLPPVEMNAAKQNFSVFSPEFPAHFKIQLTEVLRQALDSPIIRCAHLIRTGRWPQDALGDLESLIPDRLYAESSTSYDNNGATICHRNATRHQINAGIRKHRGLPESEIQRDEPLLVTQNNYGLGVYNGEVFTVLDRPDIVNRSSFAVLDRFNNCSTYADFYHTRIQAPEGSGDIVFCDKEVLGTLGDVSSYACRKASRNLIGAYYRRDEGPRPTYLHANLGYCLTAHKAQGSEFDDVIVVMEPSIRLGSQDGRRWAYTATTRSKTRLRICWL